MKDTEKQGKLFNLEVSRGIAALLVVFFHTAAIMGLEKYYGEEPFSSFFKFGYIGVDFFFVLSGFIILYIHYGDIGNRLKIFPYFIKRFIRIYPLHWIVTIVFIIGLTLYPQSDFPSVNKIMRSLFLIPQDGYPLGVVAWTLVHEVLFYFIFGILIINRLAGLLILAAWVTSILFNLFFLPESVGYFYKFILSAHNIEFLLGMGVALLIRKWNMQTYWQYSGVTGVLIIVSVIMSTNFLSITKVILPLIYGVGFSFILYALVCGEREGFFKKPGRYFIFLGSASYSIYLIHFLTLSVFIKVLIKINISEFIPLSIIYIILVICAVIVGSLLHMYIEKPLLKLCRAKMLPAR